MDSPLQQAEREEKEHEININLGYETDSPITPHSEATVDVNLKTATFVKERSDDKDSASEKEMVEGESNQLSKLGEDLNTSGALKTEGISPKNPVKEREISGNEADPKDAIKRKNFTSKDTLKDGINSNTDQTYRDGTKGLEVAVHRLRKMSKNGTSVDGSCENEKTGETTKTQTGQNLPTQNSNAANQDQQDQSETQSPSAQEVSGRCCFWRGLPVHCERLGKSWEGLKLRWKKSLCREQLTEEPLFYAAALVTCLICLTVAIMHERDQDIPICIMLVIIFCSGVTFVCKRACFLDLMAYWKNRNQVIDHESGFREECDALPPRGHSYSKRKAKQEGNTTFQHQVVDISELKPDECPKIRQVEPEDFLESTSFNSTRVHYRKYGRIRAVVHPSEDGADEEEDTRTVSSDNSRPKLENIFPKLPPKIASTYDRGRDITFPTVPLESKSRSNSTEGVFICEHTGKAACNCAELAGARQSNVEDTSRVRAVDDDFSGCERCGKYECTCRDVFEPRGESPYSRSPFSEYDPPYTRGIGYEYPESDFERIQKPSIPLPTYEDIFVRIPDDKPYMIPLELIPVRTSATESTSPLSPNDYRFRCDHCWSAASGECPNSASKKKSVSSGTYSESSAEGDDFMCADCVKGVCPHFRREENPTSASGSSKSETGGNNSWCENCSKGVCPHLKKTVLFFRSASKRAFRQRCENCEKNVCLYYRFERKGSTSEARTDDVYCFDCQKPILRLTPSVEGSASESTDPQNPTDEDLRCEHCEQVAAGSCPYRRRSPDEPEAVYHPIYYWCEQCRMAVPVSQNHTCTE